MNDIKLGSFKSPFDLRTFTYIPEIVKAKQSGGTRWEIKPFEHQHKVGICTAISTTMKASRYFKKDFSPDFQYLLQKKFYDGQIWRDAWIEGSCISNALKVGKNYGFLPIEEFTYITEQDRFLPYHEYIRKLQAIPDSEINRLLEISKQYKIKAYAQCPSSDRNIIAEAIDESDYGVQAMFRVGKEWWTDRNGITSWKAIDLEPLRAPKEVVSGHAVSLTNYDGNSVRLANSWGTDWANKGTAYFLLDEYSPVEVWKVWYEGEQLPDQITKQQEEATKIIGQIIELLQKLLKLIITKK